MPPVLGMLVEVGMVMPAGMPLPVPVMMALLMVPVMLRFHRLR